MRPGCEPQAGKAALLGPSMEDTDQAQACEQLVGERPLVVVELCHAFAIKARFMRINRLWKVGVFTDQPIVLCCPTLPMLAWGLVSKC